MQEDLKNWTLAETRRWCNNGPCKSCPFNDGYHETAEVYMCKLHYIPARWKLTESEEAETQPPNALDALDKPADALEPPLTETETIRSLRAIVEALDMQAIGWKRLYESETAQLKAELVTLRAELADERYRHDRYVDFELAQSKELEAFKKKMRCCYNCRHMYNSIMQPPCSECHADSHWQWGGEDAQ